MTENTTNKAENTEPTETTIKIELRTGLMHRNEYEYAQTQIDFTSFYISSIFWSIRAMCEAENLLDLQTDTSAFGAVQLRENLQYLAQIGEGLCANLPDYSRDLYEKARVFKQAAAPQTEEKPDAEI